MLTAEDQQEIVEKTKGISIAGERAKTNAVGTAEEVGEFVRMIYLNQGSGMEGKRSISCG